MSRCLAARGNGGHTWAFACRPCAHDFTMVARPPLQARAAPGDIASVAWIPHGGGSSQFGVIAPWRPRSASIRGSTTFARTRVCRHASLPNASEFTGIVVSSVIALLAFAGRTLWGVAVFAAGGLVLTRLFPWSVLELPGPLGTLFSYLYLALEIYASLLLVLVRVIQKGLQYVAREAYFATTALADGGDASDSAPSWEDLERTLSEEANADRHIADPMVQSCFNPSKERLRLFDGATQSDVRVVLWRDAAAWCPYCMKAQLFLEERRIPYRVEWVNMSCYGDKRPDFLSLSPGGLLPVAQLDGEVLPDSDSILARLASFSGAQGPKLLPPIGDPLRMVALERISLAYRIQGAWLSWIRSPVSDAAGEKGAREVLDELEAALQETSRRGPFVLGDFSVVECHLAPILDRMAASLAYYKGFFIRPVDGPSQVGSASTATWPHLERWFQAMEMRPSYRSLAGDFYTHAHDLPPQLGSCARNGKGGECEAHIDGLEGSGAWVLPLPRVDPYETVPAGSARAARLEAAAALLQGRVKIVPFALRALAPPGLPPVRAELADPNSGGANEGLTGDRQRVDCALRHVAAMLLCGDGRPPPRSSLSPLLFRGGESTSQRWRDCLEYVQKRVGVPRDMSFPAARQFRAHLGAVLAA